MELMVVMVMLGFRTLGESKALKLRALMRNPMRGMFQNSRRVEGVEAHRGAHAGRHPAVSELSASRRR